MKILRLTTRGWTKKERGGRDAEFNLDVEMSLDKRTEKLGPLLFLVGNIIRPS